jgi:hypothetical protein
MSPYNFIDENVLAGRPASSFMRLFVFPLDGPDLPPREPISPVPQDPPARPQEPAVPPRHEPLPTTPVTPVDPPVPATPPGIPRPIGQWQMANSTRGLARSIRWASVIHAG